MSGSVPKITSANLTVNNGLDDHPVYFVTVGATQLVIKGEAKEGQNRTADDAAQSIKWGSKIMKNVNNSAVNTKIMDTAETKAFLDAAAARFKPRIVMGTRGAPKPPTNKYFNVTRQAQTYTWVKMPMVGGLTDTGFMKKVGGFDTPVQGKVKNVILAFTDETIWPQLGKVLAADIFNGNSDRFDISSGRWQNYGNVMMVNGGANVIGLDTFDPWSQQSNLVKHGRFDELDTLVDAGKRKIYATNCAKSVGETLSREMASEYATLPVDGPDGKILWKVTKEDLKTLYLPYAAALDAGLAKGSNEVRDYLQQKVTQYRQRNRVPGGPPRKPLPVPPGGRARSRHAAPPRPDPVRMRTTPIQGIPQGILDRMDYLGWLV